MAQNKVDISVLRGALGVFAVCFLIAAVFVGASYYFRQEMVSEYKNNQAKFRDVSRKYLSVDEEERIIEQYLPEFETLYAEGILGQENRLGWLEVLKQASDSVQPPELSYEIKSQILYQPEYTLDVGAFEISTSEMELQLGLLHEGDLLNILSFLNDNADGLYSVSGCDMSRSEVNQDQDLLRAKIKASCRLRWFTVDLKGNRELML